MNRIKAALIQNRKVARYVAIGIVLTLGAVGGFSASFVIAQESDNDSNGLRVFAVWHTFSNGAGTMNSADNSLRALVGQTALGEAESQEDNPNNDFEFDLTLGFHSGVVAGTESFLGILPSPTPTLTPTVTVVRTSTPTPADTRVPGDTKVPTSEATQEATPTPTAAPAVTKVPTAQNNQPTDTPLPTETSTPEPPGPTAVPTNTPIVIVAVTTALPTIAPILPTPTTASQTPPTQEPLVVVVTTPPEPQQPPTPEPTPIPAGGVCSAPLGHGPAPVDLSLLMLLTTPLIWRFGLRR